jgi:protein ImuB
VRRLDAVADHRPERATRACGVTDVVAGRPRPAPGAVLPAVRSLQRPAWLCAEPVPLPERDGRPWLDGAPLQLLAGPERIETGWWDGALAARDYFVAQAGDGVLVWICRARLPLAGGAGAEGGWWLHGRFG